MENSISICAIVAKGRNNVIGLNGSLPWRLASDLAFFKDATLGKPIIMGRSTWESLPRQPLPGRDNIVLSRNWDYAAPGARVYSSLGPALNAARTMASKSVVDEIFIIGGAMLYEKSLPLIDRLYVTEVDAAPEGDAYFPDIDDNRWEETWRREHSADPKNDHDFVIRRLDCRLHNTM
ncbi:MAG: dihydrofolate reductase [Pseudomonadota bacterium]